MAEEHGYQSPEGHRLCANNCGFFGSPATQNYCSKCYRDICLKEAQSKSKAPADKMFAAPVSQPAVTAAAGSSALENLPESVTAAEKVEVAVVQQQPTNRCSTCRKKVRLTGFRCRCGVTFCGIHRYPEMHGCSFDFKAMGREAIAKANPLVKAEKLEMI